MLKEGSFVSARHGEEIHTYQWTNDSGAEPRGVVFMIHGLHGATLHEYYAYGDKPEYAGSLVEKLVSANFLVAANDHRGHGRSGGLRAFFEVEDLVSDTLQFVDSIQLQAPAFLIGVSLGGLISLLLAKHRPSLFRGAVLVSPAVKEPDNTFGMLGTVLYALSAVIARLAPTAPVLQLPRAPLDHIYEHFVRDQECYHGKLRALPGRSMIEAYRELNASKALISTPVAAYIGTEDDLVSPMGMEEFISSISTEDKTLKVCEGRWHVLFHEEGGELLQNEAVQWILQRAMAQTQVCAK